MNLRLVHPSFLEEMGIGRKFVGKRAGLNKEPDGDTGGRRFLACLALKAMTAACQEMVLMGRRPPLRQIELI